MRTAHVVQVYVRRLMVSRDADNILVWTTDEARESVDLMRYHYERVGYTRR
jgi:hypothetical protein